jgi:hypothetical protein
VRPGIHLAAVRARDVEHLLARLAALEPALDDLQPLQRRAVRVADRPGHEARSAVRGLELAAHRNADGVGVPDGVSAAEKRGLEARAREEAHPDARPGGREGLLAAQRVEDRLARVLLGPDAGEAGGAIGRARAARVGLAVDLLDELFVEEAVDEAA